MKKALFLLGSFALLISCQHDDAADKDPQTVVRAFFERMAKQDLDGAARLATKESQGTFPYIKMAMILAAQLRGASDSTNDPILQNKMLEIYDHISVGETRIIGQEAITTISDKKDSSIVDIHLFKEEGKWKVDFTINTLAKMGSEVKGRNGPMEDSFYLRLKKRLGPDSMKQSFKMLDSIRRVIQSQDPGKTKDWMQDNPIDSSK